VHRDAYRREAVTRHHFCVDGLKEANGYEVGEPTLSVATPSQDAIFGTNELRDAIGNDVGNPTPIFVRPSKDVTLTAGEPPDGIRNDAGKPTPSVAMAVVVTLPKDAIFDAGEPRDATREEVGNRRRASKCLISRRRIRTVNEANRSLGTLCDTILASRRQASRRIEKVGNISEMSIGIHTTLTK
jgi:hypothetical protein